MAVPVDNFPNAVIFVTEYSPRAARVKRQDNGEFVCTKTI